MEYQGPILTFGFLQNTIFGTSAGLLALFFTLCNGLTVVLVSRTLLGRSFSLRALTIPAFFLLMYFWLMCVPAIVFFAYYTAPIRFAYFASVQAVPLLVIVGAAVANTGFVRPASIVQTFGRGAVESVSSENRFLTPVYVVCLTVSVLIIFSYITTATYVPLLGALSSYGTLSGEEVRFSIYRSSDIIIYGYGLTARLLLPVCVLYSYFRRKVDGGPWRYYFWLTFGWALFAGLLTFERQVPISLVALLFLAQYLSGKRGFNRGHLISAMLLALLAGLVSLVQYNNQLSAAKIWTSVATTLGMRIWADPAYMTYAMFDQFSGNPELLLGTTVRLLAPLGSRYEPITAIGFLADLWINFRWVGVVLGSVALGFALQFIQLLCFRRNTIATITLFILFMLNSVWLIYSNMVPTMVVTVFVGGVIALAGMQLLLPPLLQESSANLDR